MMQPDHPVTALLLRASETGQLASTRRTRGLRHMDFSPDCPLG